MGFPQVFPDRGSHLGLDCCAIPFDRKALLEPETRARRTGRETSDCNSRARLGRALDWVIIAEGAALLYADNGAWGRCLWRRAHRLNRTGFFGAQTSHWTALSGLPCLSATFIRREYN